MGNTSQGCDEIKENGLGRQYNKHHQEWEVVQTILLEKDHPGRDLGEGSKPMEPRGKQDKKEEEDRVLMKLKKTQAHMSV